MTQAQPFFLYLLPPALGLPVSESPPCAKVEAYLRLTKTPYETRPGDTRRSPNKMVPFVRWPDGRMQAESSEIINSLEAQAGPDAALNAGLDPERLSRASTLASRVEEVVYDACLHDRFVAPEGWKHQRPITRELVALFIPPTLAGPAAEVIRRRQVRRARQGVMRTPKQGYRAACDAITEVETLLGDNAYLCGDRPSTADCAIWATLLHAAATPNDSPTRRVLRGSKPLIDWIFRLGEEAGLALPEGIFGERR